MELATFVLIILFMLFAGVVFLGISNIRDDLKRKGIPKDDPDDKPKRKDYE